MLRRKVARYSRRARTRGHDPQGRHRQARVADLLPVEPEAPGLDEHEGQERGQPLGEAVDRHVDEGLGPVLERRSAAAGTGPRASSCRPCSAATCRGSRASAGAQSAAFSSMTTPVTPRLIGSTSSAKPMPEVAVDPAREGDLDEEADGGEVERDLGQERRQVVGRGAPLNASAAMLSCCSMMAGADRGERDHERDDLQVPRLPQEPDRLLAADALLLGGDRAARVRPPPPAGRSARRARRRAGGCRRCRAAGCPSRPGSRRWRSARRRSCRRGSSRRR